MAPPAILTLPASVTLALWLPTVTDAASARRVAPLVAGTDELHVVLRTGTLDPPEPLSAFLADLAGTGEVGAVLPRPGDLMGAPAPRSAELVEAGEGVLLRRAESGREVCGALIPLREGFGSPLERGELVTWTADLDLADRLPVPSLLLAGLDSLSQARRDIQLALSDAVETLEDLDVARDRPDLAEELLDLSVATFPDHLLPPGLEPRRVDILERAARLLAIIDLATADDGGAVSAAQAALRWAALGHVERAARHAMCAASATRIPQ